MPDIQLMGLFEEPTPAGETIERLRQAGVEENQLTVLSDAPWRPQVLGRRSMGGTIGMMALVGAIFGVMLGLALTGGIWYLYPLLVGGQPIYSVPPSLIIIFEMTMLGTMWTTFAAFLVANRFPVFGNPPFSPQIEDGMIGVLVRTESLQAGAIERLMLEGGAQRVERFEEERRSNDRTWLRAAAATLVAVVGVLAVIELFAYDVLKIEFPSNMVDQPSIAYLQGPRLAAPADAISIDGPDLIAGQPASVPHPMTSNSIQRGQVLFSINCQLCHGPQGKGDGTVGAFFTPKPADLTSRAVQSLSDQQIFLVITQGFGDMPSLRENLYPNDRWDVINYVRTLGK
ncbi:MAG: quinol:electron acceptor oxidoreductase subunit ActD [Anaerolineales bacterium]|jgi:mono/diheme cytochrome c family protein